MLSTILLGAALTPLEPPLSRRAATVCAASALLAPRGAFASTKESIFGVGNDERCENGEGAACERLADGNELVAKLQARSRENKEKNAAAIVDKTVMQLGYSDFFDTLDKNLVKMPDGTYKALSMEEYSQLRKAGKIMTGSVDVLVDDSSGKKAF